MAESDPQFEVSASPVVARRLRPAWRKIAFMAIVPLLLVGGAVTYWIENRQYVSTDNAYVRQDKVSVSPEVGGEVVQVFVRENQYVHKGDLLFRIDPEPFRIAIAQADAQIAAAQVTVVGLQTDLTNTGSDVAGAAEDVKFYREELRRQEELMAKGFTTRARLDAAQHDYSDAQSKLAESQGEARTARAALSTAPTAPGQNPAVAAALATRRKAQLDLARSELRAPISGRVTQSERVQVGQLMVADFPALTIVGSDRSWVTANYKETDLAHMRVGQPAELTFDAYPDVKLRGHVASIGAGTGSEFSVLPAQNATGNWVKVTQRVPVRISIDQKSPRPLIAGLSSHVTVDTSR